MRPSILLWLLLTGLPALASAASPRAWLDRDSVRLGETVTLNVEIDGLNAPEPDFAALEVDFQRLGVSSRTQMSLVNGQQSASTLWAVALEPRAEGVITVPALPVGALATTPLQLTVLPAETAAAGEDVFIEVEATPSTPYVQQQVRYRVRLYYAVTLLEGQLEEPAVAGAELRRLGNDLSYQTQLANRRYNVVERRFALIPEASGVLELPAVRFRGRVLGGGRFGPGLSGGRSLSASSEPIRLEVRPMPAGLAQDWLPAALVEFAPQGEDWPTEVEEGVPLSLELRLAARGLDAARLPELALPAIDGLEIYPDQPVLRTGEDGEWLQGERRQRFALVPQRPGEFVLPELRLAWWNTETDRPEIATVPARRIRVVPARTTAPTGAAVALPDEAAQGVTAAPPIWPWQLASALLLLAWLATLGLWWRQRPRPVASSASMPPSRAGLRAALARRDPQALERELLGLARAEGHAAKTLGELLALLADATQRSAIEAFRSARWRGGDLDWSALERALRDGPRWRGPAAAEVPAMAVLPPHYPAHRSS